MRETARLLAERREGRLRAAADLSRPEDRSWARLAESLAVLEATAPMVDPLRPHWPQRPPARRPASETH